MLQREEAAGSPEPGLHLVAHEQRPVLAARLLRADPALAELPIILLTARASEEDVAAGLAAGANAYVTKPFSPQDLATRVDAVLGRD